jgi:ABC-type antimicrobial peptide transport system permease subunit
MIYILSRLICMLFIGVMIIPSSPARADDSVLPSDVFTAIMLKALNYDRNIDRQTKEKVVIGIVSYTDDEAAQGFASQVLDNVDKVQATYLLKNKPIDGQILVLNGAFDKAKFEDQLKQANVSVLVVAVNNTASVNNILEVTKGLQVSSVCGDPGCAKNGVGLEIVQRDSKPKMMINLNTAKQEGSDYDSKLLAMCELVK